MTNNSITSDLTSLIKIWKKAPTLYFVISRWFSCICRYITLDVWKLFKYWPTIAETTQNAPNFLINWILKGTPWAKLICQIRDSPPPDPSLATLLGYTTEFLGPVFCCFIFPWKVFMNLLNTGRLCMGNKIGCKSLQKKDCPFTLTNSDKYCPIINQVLYIIFVHCCLLKKLLVSFNFLHKVGFTHR